MLKKRTAHQHNKRIILQHEKRISLQPGRNGIAYMGYATRPHTFAAPGMCRPPREAVRDLIPAFFDLLEQEHHPQVRVVPGHLIFIYIHPYLDGNGLKSRILIHRMLASGGYPWIVIPVERRSEYMAALEAASVKQDLGVLRGFWRVCNRSMA